MSDDESFVARWSRRKRDAVRTPSAPPETAAEAAPAGVPPASLPPVEAEPVVDPATLPPLDSIGPGTDIRAFLAPGVPADLARTALRRAWSTDPAIRDFVGLSENAWDFNAPGGMSGFGALTAEDIRRLVARMTDAAVPNSDDGTPGTAPLEAKKDTPDGTEYRDSAPVEEVDAAMQHQSAVREYSTPLVRRRHGGALPQ